MSLASSKTVFSLLTTPFTSYNNLCKCTLKPSEVFPPYLFPTGQIKVN